MYQANEQNKNKIKQKNINKIKLYLYFIKKYNVSTLP